MNLYIGLMAGIGLALIAAFFVNDADDNLPVIDSNHAETMASLERSAESLDRMIAVAEQMRQDLIVMNHNSDAIFRSVTGCASDESCETLKQSVIDKP